MERSQQSEAGRAVREFIKRDFFYILLVLFMLCLAVFMGNAWYQGRQQLKYAQAVYHEQRQEFSDQGQQLAATKNILSQKINELGQQETKVKLVEGNYDQLQALQQAQYRHFARTLQEFGVDLKNLKSVTNLRVSTSGQFVTVTRDSITEEIAERPAGDSIEHDTVRQLFKIINYSEPAGWFTMKGSIKSDTMTFTPTFYNDFSIVAYSERVERRFWWDFFPPRRTVAKVLDKNPYSRTREFQQVIQTKKRNRRFMQ